MTVPVLALIGFVFVLAALGAREYRDMLTPGAILMGSAVIAGSIRKSP